MGVRRLLSYLQAHGELYDGCGEDVKDVSAIVDTVRTVVEAGEGMYDAERQSLADVLVHDYVDGTSW